jgi:asparagine synthase (glutamine-hydrolysing)
VGLVTKMPGDRAVRELHRMVAALNHEEFYTVGTWADETLGVYVGWVARRGSFADGMPLRNERGDVVLVFSGEDFPEPDIACRLRKRGHQVGVAAADYLVHTYEDDPSFPEGLNGRFHGLILDRTRGTAMLFNDRYGMHRVYYYECGDGFYFAAEAKAILQLRPELRTVDNRALGEFIACGCVMENRTLFEHVFVLPGAAKWTFRNGSIHRKTTYFRSREWEEQPLLEPEAYYRELRHVFRRNLPRYFEAREPIGMSLTGGLDTRMIMAWQAAQPGSLRCYTFGGMFRDCQDVRVARRVARACGQRHDVITAGREFLSRFSRYAERAVYLTDGCVDVSLCPDLYIHEKAREIAPIRMTGNYGGEVLRRVRAFKPVMPLPDLFRPEFFTEVQKANDTYSGLLRSHPLSFAVFQQAPWYHYGVLALEQTQLSTRTPYLDDDLVKTVFRAPESAYRNNDVCLQLIADGHWPLRHIRTDRGLAGRGGILSAAWSRGFLEFLFKAEYAYDYGMPQWMARIDHSLAPLRCERLFLGRHKFYHFRLWYRDALSNYVREMLLDPRTLSRPYLVRAKVEAIVTGHIKGNRNYTNEIHKLLTLELLYRLFIDSRQNSSVDTRPAHASA